MNSNEQAYIDASEELKRQQADALAEERKEFIRRAAIALWADADDGAEARWAWRDAMKLWNAKPEDC